MRWAGLAAVLCLLALPRAAAADTRLILPAGPGVPGMLCRAAIAAAERAGAIPDRLMAAIARVESGRRDPQTGAMHPWPWTINVEGEGHFYDTKAEAIAAVRGFQAAGARSIDVGCMQINLLSHPDAFPSLDAAFDPPTNAAYAARFLNQLFAQSGAWPMATGRYHSATPELAADYLRRVLAVWPEESRLAGAGLPLPLLRGSGLPLPGTGGGSPIGRGDVARVIPLPTSAGAPGGLIAPSRSLAAYRAAPIPRRDGRS